MIMKQSKICHFLAFLKDIYESPCAAIESIRLSIGQPEQSQTGKRLWQENLIVIWYSNLPQSPKSLLQFRSLPASWVLLLQGGGKQHSKHPAFHLVGSTLVAVSARVGRHSRSWRWCFFWCWGHHFDGNHPPVNIEQWKSMIVSCSEMLHIHGQFI